MRPDAPRVESSDLETLHRAGPRECDVDLPPLEGAMGVNDDAVEAGSVDRQRQANTRGT